MSALRRVLARQRGPRRRAGHDGHDGHDAHRPDAGVTLVEVVVAMSIFTVVLVVFMAAVVSMTRSTTRVDATADAGDDVRSVFLRLDRQVRYADAINQPGQGGAGRWYVEFRTPRAGDAAVTCTQWRYDPAAGSVQYRTWQDGQAPADFRTVSTRVVPVDVGGSPFRVALASVDRLNQQLTVSVTSSSGTGATGAKASLTTSFAARNSSVMSPSNTAGTSVCPQATRP